MNIIIFVTAPSVREAQKIAHTLVKEKLAACVNIISGISSVFWWEGKVDSGKEYLLVIKSKKGKFSKIAKRVKSLHSYQVPEIIAFPIICGEQKYLRWLDDSLR